MQVDFQFDALESQSVADLAKGAGAAAIAALAIAAASAAGPSVIPTPPPPANTRTYDVHLCLAGVTKMPLFIL